MRSLKPSGLGEKKKRALLKFNKICSVITGGARRSSYCNGESAAVKALPEGAEAAV